MGTNYYLESRAERCSACGHINEPERVHIGKSSSGWVFSLHVTDEFKSLDDWRAEFAKGERKIVDEYGSELTAESMLKIITERGRDEAVWESRPYDYPSWDAFHSVNHSERGPRGLLRSKIGQYCSGHGDGTWDLHPGEFS
jgi:hypothetical protein